MLLIPVLVFLSVTLAVAALLLWWMPSRASRRVQAMGDDAPADWQGSVTRWVSPLARLSTPEGDWDRSPLRIRFLQAGIRGENAQLLYFGAKTVLPLALAMVMYGLLLGSALYGLELLLVISSVALLGAYVPNLLLWLLIRSRRREVFENFPDAVDLLLICMEAGLGMDAAMTRVTQEIAASSRPLAEELHLTLLEMRAGASRERALQHLALRTGVEEVAQFALMLKQADKFGTSIGDSLRVYSADLRHKRMIRAEEAAAKIPTKLLLPLVLFIFPSIIMVILGPALIRILRTVLPMIGGTA